MKSRDQRELERLRRENSRLKQRLLIDDLTGLYNARYLKQRLQCTLRRPTAARSRPAVLFIDVDHFKQINTKHGHVCASRILNQVGQLIASVIRHDDIGFRYGGDEFVVLVQGGCEGAVTMGERVRAAIAAHEFVEQGMHGEARIRLTVSIGVHTIRANDTARDVLESADRAMYEAKKQSRNTVVSA